MPESNPLNDLADIHLPDGVSWWPLAPGWWVLIALAMIIAIALYYVRRHQQRNHYRHLSLQELLKAYQQQSSPAVYLQQVSSILRRTAMSAYPKNFNSSIKGDEWLLWLDAHCPATADSFAHGTGRALLVGPYQKAPDVDVAALHQLCTHWVKHHRNQWQTIKPLPVKKTEASHV
jgi:hypothetical protein